MNREKRNCVDCLHCKVSAKSTEKCRLCFCSETEKKARHKEPYWQKKRICSRFDDMAIIERRPLLRKRA
jgi:hypothetical protein